MQPDLKVALIRFRLMRRVNGRKGVTAPAASTRTAAHPQASLRKWNANWKDVFAYDWHGFTTATAQGEELMRPTRGFPQLFMQIPFRNDVIGTLRGEEWEGPGGLNRLPPPIHAQGGGGAWVWRD